MKRLAQKHVRYDTLNRRSRYTRAPRLDENGKPVRFSPHPSDLPVFEAVHRCGGMLPTTYLHAYRGKKSKRATQYRLNSLSTSTNTPHKGPYLTCPEDQWFRSIDTDNNELMYDVTPQGEQYLKEHGLFREPAPWRSSSKRHDGLKACAVASLELGARERGIEFGHHDTVCEKNNITPRFKVPVEYKTPEGKYLSDTDAFLEPDHLGYLAKDRILHFVIEMDLHNEVNQPTAKTFNRRKSHHKTFLQYKRFFTKQNLKDTFGVDGGVVLLYLTVNETHRENLLELSRSLSYNGKGFNFLLTKTVPGLVYDRYFKPPPIIDMFDTPFYRADGPPIYLSSLIQ